HAPHDGGMRTLDHGRSGVEQHDPARATASGDSILGVAPRRRSPLVDDIFTLTWLRPADVSHIGEWQCLIAPPLCRTSPTPPRPVPRGCSPSFDLRAPERLAGSLNAGFAQGIP